MLLVGYAFRYEPDWLISELRENIDWADGFVVYDTRDAAETWVPAKQRTRVLYNLAVEWGRTAGRKIWFLQTAPDERFEVGAGDVIHDAIAAHPTSRFTFRLRELWTPTAYRVDGVWGSKQRRRLYRLTSGGPVGDTTVNLDVNLYHLKMIEPDNRRRRREVFTDHNTWDNRRQGFGYLTDEHGLMLEEIPKGRGFTPPYRQYDFTVPGYQ